MKKKVFEKILTIGSVLIALVFVIVLLVTMFGGITVDEFNNSLVQGLFIALGIVYLLLAGGTVVYQFIDTDAVKEIVINTDKETSTKATSSVIRKLAKKNIATIEGVKCTKVVIALTEYGVRLKVGIKVVDKDVQEVAALLKCMLEDVYYEVLGYKFYAIDFKVLSLKTAYTSDMTKIEEQAKEDVETQKEACAKAAEETKEKVDNAIEEEKKISESAKEPVKEKIEKEPKTEKIVKETEKVTTDTADSTDDAAKAATVKKTAKKTVADKEAKTENDKADA